MNPEKETSENKPKRDAKGRLLPGESLNPNGRPKGTLSITELIRSRLKEVPFGDQRSYAEKLVMEIVDSAIKEDPKMRQMIWNYMDGLPKGTMDIGVDKEALNQLTKFFRSMAEVKDDEPTGSESV